MPTKDGMTNHLNNQTNSDRSKGSSNNTSVRKSDYNNHIEHGIGNEKAVSRPVPGQNNGSKK